MSTDQQIRAHYAKESSLSEPTTAAPSSLFQEVIPIKFRMVFYTDFMTKPIELYMTSLIRTKIIRVDIFMTLITLLFDSDISIGTKGQNDSVPYILRCGKSIRL